jgi:hypothetical protein
MMMKKKLIVFAIAAISTIAFIDTAFAGRKANRQVRQQERIYQGVKSGEISKRELVRLEKQQARIEGAKIRARQDGVVTKKEKMKLEAMQDHAYDTIYRMRHNNK